MSADNWRVCLKCKINAEQEAKALEVDARKSYGDVSAEVYHDLIKKAADFRASMVDPEYTLREDYEVGIYDDGKFFFSYRGSCGTCGFSYSYKHEEQVI
jgi:hypothetical protein